MTSLTVFGVDPGVAHGGGGDLLGDDLPRLVLLDAHQQHVESVELGAHLPLRRPLVALQQRTRASPCEPLYGILCLLKITILLVSWLHYKYLQNYH